MKSPIVRLVLVLLLCASPLATMAERVNLFYENFTAFSSVNMTTTSCNGWELEQCISGNGNNPGNVALKITGYAITPPIPNLPLEAQLSVKFAKTKNTDYDYVITVSVEGDGYIDGNKKTIDVNVKSNALSEESFVLSDVNEESMIKFAAKNSSESVYIDDVIVSYEGTAAPTFSIAEGYYKTAQTLTMSCTTDGAIIYYTDDGTMPTAESTQYTGAITISESKTIKALAIKGSKASQMTSAYYYVDENLLYGDAFTNWENGYWKLEDRQPYQLDDKNFGPSAVLSFRMSGRSANSSMSITITECYTDGSTTKYRTIVDGETLEPAKDVWTTKTYGISAFHDNARFTINIESNNCNIDDVLIVSPPMMTLDENANNAETLATYNNKVVDVTAYRTLRVGIWNTFCLPFDVTRSILNQAFGEGETTMTMYSSYASDVMTFTNVVNNATIPAGTPFLLKTTRECTNPVFRAVTITAAEPLGISYGGVTFQGIFSSTALATDGSDLFIGTDGYLYVPAVNTNVMGGLRAYIHRATNAPVRLYVDDETLDIRSQNVTSPSPSAVYTLQGQRTTMPCRGLYIINNKKVIVK